MKLRKSENSNIDNLKRLDNITSLKLLMYMNEYIEKHNIKSIRERYEHPEIMEADFDYAFNIWLSLDYVDSNGKAMIDSMIQEKMNDLMIDEVNILRKKRESYLSVYRVISQNRGEIELIDLLLNKTIILDENEFIKNLKLGQIFMARIIKYKDVTISIDEVKLITEECIEKIIYSIKNKYSFLNKNIENYSLKSFLKKHSYLVYCIVFESFDIIRKLKLDESVNEELTKFRDYMTQVYNIDTKILDKRINCLNDLYKQSMRDRYLNINEISFEIIYEYLIYLCNSNESSLKDIKFQLMAIRIYAKYLKEIQIIDEFMYKEILNICDSREVFQESYDRDGMLFDFKQLSEFEYKIKSLEFNIDQISLALPILQNIEIQPILFDEFDMFIEDIQKYKIIYKNRQIVINEEQSKYYYSKKLIIFDAFSRFYKFIEIDYGNHIKKTEQFKKFKGLENSQKIIMFLHFIWFDFNWKKISNTSVEYDNFEYRFRYKYLKHLLNLKAEIYHDFDQWRFGVHRDEYKIVNTSFKIYKSKIFIPVILYLFNDLNLVKLKIKEQVSFVEILHGLDIQYITITSLGHEVMYHLLLKECQVESAQKIINFRFPGKL